MCVCVRGYDIVYQVSISCLCEQHSGKGYVWSQTVWDTENNLFTNDDYSDQQNFTLQLQLCRNITLPMNAVCEAATPAPVYLVRRKEFGVNCSCWLHILILVPLITYNLHCL